MLYEAVLPRLQTYHKRIAARPIFPKVLAMG